MNKYLLSNVSFLNNKVYLKLADRLHFKKYILVTVVTSTSITTDGIELLHSIFLMTCKMQKQTTLSRVFSEQLVKILAFKIRNPNTANQKPKLLSILKLPFLADVPCRLHGNYVDVTLLKRTQLNTLTVKITLQSYLIWRQALNARCQPSTARTRPRTLHNETSSCRGGQLIGSFRALTQQITFRTRPLVIHIW